MSQNSANAASKGGADMSPGVTTCDAVQDDPLQLKMAALAISSEHELNGCPFMTLATGQSSSVT